MANAIYYWDESIDNIYNDYEDKTGVQNTRMRTGSSRSKVNTEDTKNEILELITRFRLEQNREEQAKVYTRKGT